MTMFTMKLTAHDTDIVMMFDFKHRHIYFSNFALKMTIYWQL